MCVVFIFVYAFGYSLGFGPAAWLYGAEVSNPNQPPMFTRAYANRSQSR